MLQTYIGATLLGALVVLPLYLAARLLYLRRHPRPAAPVREVILALFILFWVAIAFQAYKPGSAFAPQALFATAWQRLQTGQAINWVPFHNISAYFRHYSFHPFFINIVGNVGLFMPIGFCLPLLWQRWQKGGRAVWAGLAFSLSIETIQLFIARNVDVDDLILNTLGTLLGYLAYLLMRRLLPSLKHLALAPKQKGGPAASYHVTP